MQIISVTFPKKVVVTVAVTAKHVVSADLTEILLDLDAINGEIIGTTAAQKTDKIEATKLAIETAIETAGGDVPALTPFADYPDYVADAVALAAYESLFNFNKATQTLEYGGYNSAAAPTTDCIMPDAIGGVDILIIQQECCDKIYTGDIYGPKITALRLPANLTTIRLNAFRYNAIAGTVSIPSGVATLTNRCFMTNLITKVIAPHVTTFETLCLYNNNISEIEVTGLNPVLAANAMLTNPIVKITISANATLGADAVGDYSASFIALYDGNGKLAGTYEYAAGSWSKTA